MVFSVTKSLASLVIHRLVDQGRTYLRRAGRRILAHVRHELQISHNPLAT
ncbi:hypothetical protein [Mycobacterium lepromatosis]